MKRVLNLQKRRNKGTRDDWASFAEHRRIVTDLLIGSVDPAGKRLCVLGAGNCNDIELARLSFAFQETHLVDFDETAVRLGVENQMHSPSASVRLHAAVDLSGIAHLLEAFRPDRPTEDADVAECIRQAVEFKAPELGQPFDLVASQCMLTQLFDGVVYTLGEQHPRYAELVLAIRMGHLRLLLDLLHPGGVAILFTDVVSSSTWRELETMPDEDLPEALKAAVEGGNFFTGANPFAIRNVLRDDELFTPLVDKVTLIRPWKWRIGARTFVVCALGVKKAAP